MGSGVAVVLRVDVGDAWDRLLLSVAQQRKECAQMNRSVNLPESAAQLWRDR